jgi:hypothetical protein
VRGGCDATRTTLLGYYLALFHLHRLFFTQIEHEHTRATNSQYIMPFVYFLCADNPGPEAG